MSDVPRNQDKACGGSALRRMERILDRTCIGLLIAAIPICEAKVPHYLGIALACLACTVVSLVFSLMLKIATQVGWVGGTPLADTPVLDPFGDDLTIAPPRAAPITYGIQEDASLRSRHADDVGRTHEVRIPGVGKVTYWVVDGGNADGR